MDRRTRRKIRQFFLGYDEDHTLAQPLNTLPERTWSFLTGARWQTIVTKPVPKQLPDLAGEKAADGPKAITSTGYMVGHEPRKSWIQSIFSRLLEARQEDGKSLPYPFYGIARFGFWDAMFRTWVYHVHPKNGLDWLQNRIRRYHLQDRRNKKTYSRTVYAIDRDGDLYLVECPSCHDTQHLIFNRDNGHGRLYTKAVPESAFQCFPCDIGFWVHLEDGLREIKDHREGVPPLPSMVVWDDRGTIHLGIAKDAPWWWTRREICRDLRNGKDAHGHYHYEIFPTDPTSSMEAQCGNSCPPETEQPS